MSEYLYLSYLCTGYLKFNVSFNPVVKWNGKRKGHYPLPRSPADAAIQGKGKDSGPGTGMRESCQHPEQKGRISSYQEVCKTPLYASCGKIQTEDLTRVKSQWH